MPADFFIDAGLGMVFSKATGVISLADGEDHMDRLCANPEFRTEFNQLFDFRQARGTALSDDALWSLASRKIFSRDSPGAFVVAGDLEFGLSRVFATYREMQGERGILVFRDMTEALSWLSLTEEPDAALFCRLKPSEEA
jgi:hypothetical protein